MFPFARGALVVVGSVLGEVRAKRDGSLNVFGFAAFKANIRFEMKSIRALWSGGLKKSYMENSHLKFEDQRLSRLRDD